MKLFRELVKFLKSIFNKPKPPKPEPVISSDEFLTEIANTAKLVTEPKPDRTKVRFDFENGEYITFETRNVQEVWVNGHVKRSDGIESGFDANRELRHRILAVLGEGDARNLGGNQVRLGQPEMPIVEMDETYYWLTANNKRMYELNDASVYAIRVTNRLKEELGVTSKMVKASGKVLSYV